jgi:hypothetical protein
MSLFNLFSQVNASTDLNTLLCGFTGSEVYYRHSLTRLIYTEGVGFVAEKFGSYWLVDKILIEASLNKNLSREEFQVWTLARQSQGFTLSCTDGNGSNGKGSNGKGRTLFSEAIPYSDFAAGKLTLWLTDGVLLLPSEY